MEWAMCITSMMHIMGVWKIGRLNQIEVLARDDGLEPIVYMQFVQRVLNMVANRCLADAHHGGNFTSGLSFCQQRQDFKFPSGQITPLEIS